MVELKLDNWTGTKAGSDSRSPLTLKVASSKAFQRLKFHFFHGSHFAFSDVHALLHRLDGNASSGHFDVDEERRWGQTGPVCIQQVNVSIT